MRSGQRTNKLCLVPRRRCIKSLCDLLFQSSIHTKSIWLLSVLIVLPAVWGASFASENTVWIVSAFTPFLALLLITESAKSMLFGMNELEMASRFSLKNIVLARLTILGIFNFAIFCIIIPICHIANSISLVQTGVYFLVKSGKPFPIHSFHTA